MANHSGNGGPLRRSLDGIAAARLTAGNAAKTQECALPPRGEASESERAYASKLRRWGTGGAGKSPTERLASLRRGSPRLRWGPSSCDTSPRLREGRCIPARAYEWRGIALHP